MEPFFSTPGTHPFEQLEWENRSARISSDSGEAIFEQDNIEVPVNWSQLATKVVASKYFYGDNETGEREHSVKQLVHRVCKAIAERGRRDGYFATDADAEVFYNELTWLCLNQYGAFNSPVWFNVGLYHQYGVGKNSAKGNWFFNRKTKKAERASTQYEYPQGSACFIQSVDDNMESIMQLAFSEDGAWLGSTGRDATSVSATRVSTLRMRFAFWISA